MKTLNKRCLLTAILQKHYACSDDPKTAVVIVSILWSGMKPMGNLATLKNQLALILSLVMLAIGVDLSGQPSLQPNISASQPEPDVAGIISPAQVIADFDGDRLPDQAELISNGLSRNIHLNFSSPRAASLRFTTESPEIGTLQAEDIDHDSDEDLVWISNQAMGHIALWLNNGIGELSRVREASEYSVEIKRLIDASHRSRLSSSSAHALLKAIAARVFAVPAQLNNDLANRYWNDATTLVNQNSVVNLPPCVTRYPKRGPPYNIS